MSLTQRDLQVIDARILAKLQELLGQAIARPQSPAFSPDERFCPNYAALKAATGLSVGMLQAIKRASRGKPDSPFRGRGAFPSHLTAWLAARPEFAPSSR